MNPSKILVVLGTMGSLLTIAYPEPQANQAAILSTPALPSADTTQLVKEPIEVKPTEPTADDKLIEEYHKQRQVALDTLDTVKTSNEAMEAELVSLRAKVLEQEQVIEALKEQVARLTSNQPTQAVAQPSPPPGLDKPGRVITVRQAPVYYQPQYQSCTNGNCAYQRRGVFGWRN